MPPSSPRREPPSNEELLASCRRGDAQAWRQLVDRHGRLVYGIPRAMGLQRADAEDVFQRVFIELHRSVNEIRDPERLSSWLVTVARREVFRLRRGKERFGRLEPVVDDRPELAFEPSVESALEQRQERDRVRSALESLGEPCRRLLRLLFSDPPTPYRRVAAELGMAVGSLGPIRARCLARLRRALLASGAAEFTAPRASDSRRDRRRPARRRP